MKMLKLTTTYLSGDNNLKRIYPKRGSRFDPTRNSSCRPILLNLVIAYVFNLDLGRAFFPQGLQSEYPSINNPRKPTTDYITIRNNKSII